MVHTHQYSPPTRPVPQPKRVVGRLTVQPHLFSKVQVIAKPLPPDDLRHAQTRIAVRQREEEIPAPRNGGQDHHGSNPGRLHALAGEPLAGRQVALLSGRLLARGLGGLVGNLVVGRVSAEDELNQGTSDEGRGEMGRQVMVQEQLAAHDEEGEVVGRPGEEEEARGVVEAGACA